MLSTWISYQRPYIKVGLTMVDRGKQLAFFEEYLTRDELSKLSSDILIALASYDESQESGGPKDGESLL